MASKPNTSRQHKHFAVLIDADNAPAAIVEGLFEEIAKYGFLSVKHISSGCWVILKKTVQQTEQLTSARGIYNIIQWQLSMPHRSRAHHSHKSI